MRLHEVIWPNQYVMIALGLWPMRSETGTARRLFAYLRSFVALFAVMGLLVPEVMTVAVYWGDISILGEFGSILVIQILTALKIVYYVSRRASFRSVYQHIKGFWGISDDQRERENYEQLANAAKLASIVCIWLGVINFLIFELVVPLTWLRNRREMNDSLRHRPLILELFYGFDTQPTPTYEILLVSQNICMIYAIYGVVGCDCTALAFMVHVSGQFKLIGYRFRAIGRKIGEQDDDALRAEIRKLIAQHQHVIRVTNELNALLSPVIFCQMMSSGLQICLAGYALIKGESSGAEIVKFLVFFMTMLIDLLLWCAPAELLIQESTAIAEAIYYDVPWFKLTPSQQRDLNFVVSRAQKGCHVKTLYQIMSIRRITEVINAAGSYMALLKSMEK